MCMLPVILKMKHARALMVTKAEFGFVVAQVDADNFARIRRIRRGVNVEMMDRSIRPTVRGIRDDLCDLAFEVFRREPT